MGIIEEIVFLECCEHHIILIQLLQTSDLWPEKSNCSVIANGYHWVRFSWTAGLSCLSWKLLTTMWSLWLPGVFRCPDTFRNLPGSTHSGGHCPSTLWESERSRESRGREAKDERRWGRLYQWSHLVSPRLKANREAATQQWEERYLHSEAPCNDHDQSPYFFGKESVYLLCLSYKRNPIAKMMLKTAIWLWETILIRPSDKLPKGLF